MAIPLFKKLGNEKNIAILDNCSINFLLELKKKQVDYKGLLTCYDLLLIPGWELNEINIYPPRKEFVEKDLIVTRKLPIFYYNEEDLANIFSIQDLCFYRIFQASVSRVAQLIKYLNLNVKKTDPLDIDSPKIWLKDLFNNWPIQNPKNPNLRKNAGEISCILFIEILSYSSSFDGELTIFSQDSDSWNFLDDAAKHMDELVKKEPGFGLSKTSFDLSFKTNDFILCSLFRNKLISISDIDQLRTNQRYVTYHKIMTDKTVAQKTDLLDNSKFKTIIQNKDINIVH